MGLFSYFVNVFALTGFRRVRARLFLLQDEEGPLGTFCARVFGLLRGIKSYTSVNFLEKN